MQMNTKQHVTIVGAFHIALGALGMLFALLAFIFIVGGGLISGDQEAIAITGTVGTVIAGVVGVLSLPWIVGGFGVLQHWNWARILVLILSVLELTGIPIGTIIGIYSIWVLVQHDTEVLFGFREE
jgi:hypothetical protein